MHLTPSHLQILGYLQRDCTLTTEQLSHETGVSPTTLWRRIKEMDETKVIQARVALLDPEQTGHTICAFVSVNLRSHSAKHRTEFESFIQRTPEVMASYLITGPYDYMLHIRVRSIREYEKLLMEKILSHASVATASSNLSLRQNKYTTELPL